MEDSPRNHVIKMAEQVGDPMPVYHGGPDSQAMIKWQDRWDSVERALKLASAASRMADAIDSISPPPTSELSRARDEFRHQQMMLLVDS